MKSTTSVLTALCACQFLVIIILAFSTQDSAKIDAEGVSAIEFALEELPTGWVILQYQEGNHAARGDVVVTDHILRIANGYSGFQASNITVRERRPIKGHGWTFEMIDGPKHPPGVEFDEQAVPQLQLAPAPKQP